MIDNFDKQLYIEANKDIELEINKYLNITEYLEVKGLKDIQNGNVKFHIEFEPYNEALYLDLFSDIKEAVEQKVFNTGFEHFCHFGYKEIISRNRKWDLALLKDTYYANIEGFENFKIKGWAGSNKNRDVEVSIYIKNVMIGKSIPNIERNDVRQAHKDFNFCKGFSIEILQKTFLLFLKNNLEEDIVLTISIDETPLVQEYIFTKSDYFKEFALTFTKENFLSFVDFLGTGFEKELSISQLIDCLDMLHQLGLDKSMVNERNLLLLEILNSETENDNEKDKLYIFLHQNHDILLSIAKGLLHKSNSSILFVVNKVLSTMNYLDANELLLRLDGNKIFDTTDIELNVKKDELIFYLINNPNEIITVWNTFGKEERIENAINFMNLFVFLQDFSSLKELLLSTIELHDVFSITDQLSVDALQDRLFKDGKIWESMLLTVYVCSCNINSREYFVFIDTTIKNLHQFDDVNTSILKWLIVDLKQDDKFITSDNIKLWIDIIQPIVDEKSLWDDLFIKEIYHYFLNVLLSKKHYYFNDFYKLGLEHYLLEKSFFPEKKYLTQKYLEKENLLIINIIEKSRFKSISLLGNISANKVLLEELNKIEHLSYTIVNKVKSELYRNVLNLETDEIKLLEAANEMSKIGGLYDKLIASKKIRDKDLYDLNETSLIENTLKWKYKSLNNYWYREALLSRSKVKAQKWIFHEELYMELLKEQVIGQEYENLIRLFYSEVLFHYADGFTFDTVLFKNKTFREVSNTLEKLNDFASIHASIFEYYIQVCSSTKPLNVSLEPLNVSFETFNRLQEILKSNDINMIKPQTAKKYIEQSMIFPYTLIMVSSTQSNIGTRQKVIRNTWFNRAKELGIDVMFVVGGNDKSEVKDDIIKLNVEETYERLPQKSVEMFRFANEEFSHDRFMKVNDTCFVNLDAYFSDEVLFISDYYGNIVHSPLGSIDRALHQTKSKTIEAKKSLDLSPEPSYYADGEGGYILSKIASKELITAFDSDHNKELIDNSYREDKLVGDLLHNAGFNGESSNFTSVAYKKINDNHEVLCQAYNLYPTLYNDIKILRCETEEAMLSVWNGFFSSTFENNQNQLFSNKASNLNSKVI